MCEFSDPWILIPTDRIAAHATVELERDEAKHVHNVLRRRVGDRIVLADGAGEVASAHLVECGRKGVAAKIDRVVRFPMPDGRMDLVMAVLHTKAMDWAVQKAVELAVARFQPVLCARSQGDLGLAVRRLAHWQNAATQAIKQCRRPWAMAVEEPMSLRSWLDTDPPSGIVADAQGIDPGVVSDSHCARLLVGPEGGLTETELGWLDQCGWKRVRFGPHILRSETAAVAGIAILAAKGS